MAGKYASGLSAGQYVDLLKADFSELENVEKIVGQALYRLMVRDYKSSAAYKYGVSFDQWQAAALMEKGGFADVVRAQIGKTLAIVRAKGIQKARSGMVSDRGAASSAIMRRTYKGSLGGNLNIMNPRKRMSSKERPWSPGKQRTVSDRTAKINKYYGPDRAFILRIMEVGRDEFYANSTSGVGGRGSRASYGRRGAMAPRPFFHTLQADMEAAAARMGQDLTMICEQLIKEKFG